MIHGYLTDRDDNCLFTQVARTTRFSERLCGLLFSQRFGKNAALLIEPCSAVHTFGMRYAVGMVFMDKDWRVIKIIKLLKPWRIASADKACSVLEINGAGLEKIDLTHGQQLKWHRHE